MQENGVHKAIREGRVAIGQMAREFITRGLPLLADYAGLDYMMFDYEHGGMSMADIADMAVFFKATSVSPFVRIPMEWIDVCGTILDQGIMGVQVSNVITVDDARKVVQHAKYAPVGDRGIAAGGPHTNFRNFTRNEYVPWANANVIAIAALETVEGVESVDAIAALDGIDAISIGHSDLTQRMGIHMQLEHPRFKDVVRRVIEACKKHGKIGRIYPQNDAQLAEYVKLGYRMIAFPQTDLIMYRDALKTQADRYREVSASSI